jgi:hypothetical protein
MTAARYRRSKVVAARRVDDDIFLVTAKTIEHLNATTTRIWDTLASPKPRNALHAVLRAAYPQVAPQRISADLTKLLRSLERRRLVRRLG